ncbi:conserved hypothetical protein [Solidesulfovibrio fructosivorans JJ]]|uniref:Lipoprotein n=1 Tax=Solidesulfovibrio fructosivorans JJ] TaxID=596151 RepID=E1JVE9_SOLFR|nr:hypothetical protein [Solidesulfovibrio fructosivorans]EFL51743.1 conserved hypothetical protein [Solidesulfovibrio fructosivorans JJ]]
MHPRPYFPRRLSLVLSLAILLTGAALLAGCGAGVRPAGDGRGAPPMSVKEFYEFCSTLPTPGACLSDPICVRYRTELTSPPPDLTGCLSLCRQTQNALYVDNLTNGCGPVLDRAADLCDQFCRRRASR